MGTPCSKGGCAVGLRFTTHDDWQRWQSSRRRIHVLRDRLRGDASAPLPPRIKLWSRGSNPELLVACDSDSPTNHHALLSALESSDQAAILAVPEAAAITPPGPGWHVLDSTEKAFDNLNRVASIGDHLAVGAWAKGVAQVHRATQIVVQHGLLTPWSPPPPEGALFLAWSEADAHFVSEGRSDLSTRVTGSPLLASAAQHKPERPVSRFEVPVFLGQLHGAELSRIAMTKSVTTFWRMTGASYRPHPREEDRLSRIQHRLWRKMGIRIDGAGSLAGLDQPVVAAFSTGILESAARGVPSWAFHVNPPSWLREMWERYELAVWGDAPTKYSVPVGKPIDELVQSFWSTP